MQISLRLTLAAVFALALGGLLLLAPAGSAAQELPPRPTPPTATVAPTATPVVTATPETTATPAPAEEERRRPRPTPAPGRITGTVIEQRSGAPAPGMTVYVGGVAVTSDASGNYVRDGLPPGQYTVWLAAGPAGISPAQPVLLAEVAPGATVVQHLAFTPAP